MDEVEYCGTHQSAKALEVQHILHHLDDRLAARLEH
jgi:hypothetical protein